MAYPCHICDHQSKSVSESYRHRQDCQKNRFDVLDLTCDSCNYKADNVDSLDVHKQNVHGSTHVCQLCGFQSCSEIQLEQHVKDVHKRMKYPCERCNLNFETAALFKDHKEREHPITPRNSFFPCDQCKYKATSIEDLDRHINSNHKLYRKNTDIRDVRKKKACDPRNPLHSTTCCDREPGRGRQQVLNFEEKMMNGPCEFWNKGFCKFGDLCRFAHVEECKFGEHCWYGDRCRYFHFNKNTFLGQRYQSQRSQSYQHQEENFPPIFLGTNAAGILNKKDSFERNIDLFKPSVFFLQETKTKSKIN